MQNSKLDDARSLSFGFQENTNANATTGDASFVIDDVDTPTKPHEALNDVIKIYLPPELWRQIFTCVAGRPKIAWSHFFRSSETTVQYSWTRTAWSLTLVCRSWHIMAIDLLYGDVALTSLSRACLFHLALSTSPRKYGHLVRSISISHISAFIGDNSNRAFFECMSGIVVHCPHLENVTLGRTHFNLTRNYFTRNWEDLLSDIALNIRELHLDDHSHRRCDWGLRLSSRDLEALSTFSNLVSLTAPWPMDGIHHQDASLPRLRDLTLSIVSNVCSGLPPLALPSLQNLTFSLQYKVWNYTNGRIPVPQSTAVPEGDLHRIFSTVLVAYGPLLRRLHLNPVEWNCSWGDLVINNQLLLNYCPSLEHFITYSAGASKTSHHPTLRWIDIWIPAEQTDESGTDTTVHTPPSSVKRFAGDPTTACVEDAANFPALRGCRFLDISLSPITDLPILISPENSLRDQAEVRWTMPPFRISQTRDLVSWVDPYDYDSDAESSYEPSSEEEDEDSDESSDDDGSSSELSQSSDAEPRFNIEQIAQGIVY